MYDSGAARSEKRQMPSAKPYFFLRHRACAALLAIAVRRALVSRAALAFPPRLPSAAAALWTALRRAGGFVGTDRVWACSQRGDALWTGWSRGRHPRCLRAEPFV